MSDRIDITQLREHAEREAADDIPVAALPAPWLLALLDLAEAAYVARNFVDCVTYGEEDQVDASSALADALARFDFGDQP